MDSVNKEELLKSKSKQECFLSGLSSKISNILENNDYNNIIDDNNNNDKIGLLHYIIFISLLLYLIYLFC